MPVGKTNRKNKKIRSDTLLEPNRLASVSLHNELRGRRRMARSEGCREEIICSTDFMVSGRALGDLIVDDLPAP